MCKRAVRLLKNGHEPAKRGKLRPLFFFFKAEDGIRDLTVTGVQPCALPISAPAARWHKPVQGAQPPYPTRSPQRASLRTAPAAESNIFKRSDSFRRNYPRAFHDRREQADRKSVV